MRLPTASRRAAPAHRHPSLKPVALAVAAALGAPLAALAGPVGPTVVNGTVQVTQPDANSMLIKQDSSKAIINWRSFSIAAGEHVRFQQPDSGSVTLNRVTTAAAPSAIFGSLSANGKIFLVNPAGVVFGKGASVDVGGLVASTLSIRDDDFLAGRYVFTDGGGAGAVRNQGSLSALDGGTIALLGAQVSNDGMISARLGTVGLAAGGKVALDFGGDGLTRIVVDAARINALVENGGAILSEGGQVSLTARALGALADTVVRNTGVVSARSLLERDGRILLDGGDAGRVEVAGTLDASGPHGGAVTVLGRDIALASGAAIDAHGDSGGGTVLVGGAYRGADPAIPHAASTTMAAGSSIRADALASGDGGRIVLWSDGLTTARGSLSARGAAAGGNGGLIETSGAKVDFTGLAADASAARGKAGSWLLDPTDVVIGTSEAGVISGVLNTGTDARTDSSGAITVNADIRKTAGGDATLTLHAAQSMTVSPAVTISSTANKLNVDLRSDASFVATGDRSIIDTNGGTVKFTAASYIGTGLASIVNTHGGALTFTATPTNGYIHTGDNSIIDTVGGALGFTAGSYLYTGDSSIIDTQGGAIGFTAGSYMYTGDSSVMSTHGGAVTFTAAPANGYIYTGDNSVIDTEGGAVGFTAGSYMYTGDSSVMSTGGGALNFTAGSYLYTGDSSVMSTRGGAVNFTAGDYIGVGSGAGIDTGGGALTFVADLAPNPAAGGSGIVQTGSAKIEMGPGSVIRTLGGNLTFYGGNPAATDDLNWVTAHPEGILLTGATIDTRDASGTLGGNIVMVGKGYDGDGGAGIAIDGGTLLSASGNIGLVGYGGIGASYGYAGAGVRLRLGDYAYGGKISTTTGAISISGQDGSFSMPSGGGTASASLYGAPGLEAELSTNGSISTAAGNIVLRGDTNLPTGDGSYAVDLSIAGGGISSGGRLEITGIGHQGMVTGLNIHGAYPASSASPALTAGAGGLLLAGHGVGGVGVQLTSVAAATTDGGQLSVAGESAADSGVALADVFLGRPGMSGNIAVRAYSAGTLAPMLAVWDEVPDTTLQTSGVVAILPGGVDGGGALTSHPEVPITVGDSQASGFGVSLAALGLGASGTSRVVIGSQEQRGKISFGDATRFNGDLTLQNDAAGSGGIALNSSVDVSGQLTLSSGGTVSLGTAGCCGAAAISASGLLLHGSMPESNFQLAQAGNQVGRFAAVFDRPKSLQSADFGDVNFSNAGALTVASLAGAGFSSAGNAALTVSAPNTVVAGDLLLQTAGNLTLGRNIATLGSDITLVTGGVFLNPTNSQLLPAAGGTWRVFADTWVGEIRGGLAPSTPHPNLYGCTYGSSCAAGVAGNHFFYRAQPVLTITPDSIARAYGDPNPALTYSANLINGDTLADAASGGYTTTAVPSSPVGSYATAGSFSSPVGYQIVVKPGSLTVNPATLLALIDNKSKVYGDADPALSASFSGFKLGDTAAIVSGLTLSTATGQAATAGNHPITGANASAPNYAISYQPGVLSVAKAPLAVNITDKSKTYGDADPALSATFSGFRYADTAAVVSGLTLSTATGAAATAGSHPIEGANASADNYSFVYHPGTLSVARAPLTVLVDDKRKQYGDADPALTYRVDGLKYADSAADVGVNLSTATGAAASAGTHPIVATTGAASNYVVSSQPGTLTVDKAPLLVSADDKAKVYGDPDPAWTASATGLKYADTAAVVTGLVFAAPTGAAATAGTHAITPSNGSAANYTLSYRPGTLSVAKAMLTVTADNKSKVYGAPDPVLSATMSGFKYADSAAVVSGLALSAPTGAAATAGSHPIVAAGASAANYVFSYLPGVLSVEPGVLSYVANPAIGFQDMPALSLGGSVTGFAYGDTLASATTGVLAFTSAATPHSAPGAYAVLGAGLSAPNYRFVQAASNGTALTMYVSPAVMRPTIAKDVTFDSSNLYEKNFGTPHVCVATGPLDTGLSGGADNNDALAIEWSRVRVSPNLSNCLGLGQRNSCSDF